MKNTYLTYREYGLSCLPTKKDKTPDVFGTWKGGISDPDSYNGKFGIGVICGEISGNLECIDFDNHFGDAKKIISEWMVGEVKELYNKYHFPIESTMNGGFHLLYRCNKIEGNQKLAQRPKKTDHGFRPDTIIETRGEGGYFVAAPTEGYILIKNSFENIPLILESEREILLENARSFNTWIDKKDIQHNNTDKPGDVYNESAEGIQEALSALISAGWTEVRDGKWIRPGKKDGISATFGVVAPNIFYVFSSNAYPFEPMRGYKPFGVVGLLKYNGDFQALAKDLSANMTDNYQKAPSANAKKEEPKVKIDLNEVLLKAYIDLEIPVSKPPVIMKIKDKESVGVVEKRLFTLGNFSAITGKSKSKKTFLTSLFLAAASKNGTINNKFLATFPESKQATLMFDTEQSEYDSYITAKRVIDLAGYNCPNFGAFGLREFNPLERCDIIEYALEKYKGVTGFVVIDGIADLATAINDEIEASRVVSLLMKWTKIYDCHICVVIHQNKNDDYATGHLGSAILKKAETIISVKKSETDYVRSNVKCSLIRGAAEFKDFDFIINERGLPEVDESDRANYDTSFNDF